MSHEVKALVMCICNPYREAHDWINKYIRLFNPISLLRYIALVHGAVPTMCRKSYLHKVNMSFKPLKGCSKDIDRLRPVRLETISQTSSKGYLQIFRICLNLLRRDINQRDLYM